MNASESADTVKSGLFKDILSPDRPLSDAERELLQQLIDSSYSQFVGVVSEGRGLSADIVRTFADGRVFSGEQALELGLVDELGMRSMPVVWLPDWLTSMRTTPSS